MHLNKETKMVGVTKIGLIIVLRNTQLRKSSVRLWFNSAGWNLSGKLVKFEILEGSGSFQTPRGVGKTKEFKR